MSKTVKPLHDNGTTDKRYVVLPVYMGHPKLRHVALFCRESIGHYSDSETAWRACCHHAELRQSGRAWCFNAI